MTSAEGPSRAGPISERVVKPDALKIRVSGATLAGTKPTLCQDRRRKTPVLA